MEEFELDDIRLRRAAHAVLEELEDVGGRVRDHTLNRTRFTGFRPRASSYRRSGYVGLYRPYGSDDLTVRIRVWNPIPRLLVRLTFLAGLITLPFFLFIPASPNTWFWSGTLLFTLLAIAFLLVLGSRDGNAALEAMLAERLHGRLEALRGVGPIEDETEADDEDGEGPPASAERGDDQEEERVDGEDRDPPAPTPAGDEEPAPGTDREDGTEPRTPRSNDLDKDTPDDPSPRPRADP